MKSRPCSRSWNHAERWRGNGLRTRPRQGLHATDPVASAETLAGYRRSSGAGTGRDKLVSVTAPSSGRASTGRPRLAARRDPRRGRWRQRKAQGEFTLVGRRAGSCGGADGHAIRNLRRLRVAGTHMGSAQVRLDPVGYVHRERGGDALSRISEGELRHLRPLPSRDEARAGDPREHLLRTRPRTPTSLARRAR